MSDEGLNFAIEHTLLKQVATRDEVIKLVEEAHEHQFYGVCVPPYFVADAKKHIKALKSKSKLVTVIGFPQGYNHVQVKVEEIKRAVNDGAHELDVVINLAAFKSGDFNYVKNEAESIVTACNMFNKPCKLIIESGELDNDELKKMLELIIPAKPEFVKTSTGFAKTGAVLAQVKLMRELLPEKIRIKASGGIKTKSDVLNFMEAGANRIGTSSGPVIINE